MYKSQADWCVLKTSFFMYTFLICLNFSCRMNKLDRGPQHWLSLFKVSWVKSFTWEGYWGSADDVSKTLLRIITVIQANKHIPEYHFFPLSEQAPAFPWWHRNWAGSLKTTAWKLIQVSKETCRTSYWVTSPLRGSSMTRVKISSTLYHEMLGENKGEENNQIAGLTNAIILTLPPP